MRLFLNRMTDKVRNDFTTVDLGLLKLYGALFGLVMGAYFPDFARRYLPVLVGLFLLLLVRFLYLLFRKHKKTGFSR